MPAFGLFKSQYQAPMAGISNPTISLLLVCWVVVVSPDGVRVTTRDCRKLEETQSVIYVYFPAAGGDVVQKAIWQPMAMGTAPLPGGRSRVYLIRQPIFLLATANVNVIVNCLLRKWTTEVCFSGDLERHLLESTKRWRMPVAGTW
ncbi:hypothetical protein SAY87_001437 [Trapa incisa]|uniref:Uncharacterized protein n=1 Tax=Trapa incisa TaxID=236973 RepID=A0AAN7JAF3_9MYRT|nr:hypothetical protein SAY87_001437 [Trapa incisa]